MLMPALYFYDRGTICTNNKGDPKSGVHFVFLQGEEAESRTRIGDVIRNLM